MEHRTLDEIRHEASVLPFGQSAPVSPRELRRARLERFATVLERHSGPVRALTRIEYLPDSERRAVRSDDSPLALAYRDPVLREQGLASDRLGDAIAFFDITPAEAHHLLCDCHYGGRMTAHLVASRVRAIANRKSWGEVWGDVRSKLAFW